MAAFLYRVPSGIAGAVNRPDHATVEPGLLLVSSPPLLYGAAVVVDATTGRYRAFAANDTAAVLAGVIVRPYPESSAGTSTDLLGPVVPDTRYVHDILKRGYVTVKQTGSVASAKDGRVYLRTTSLSGSNPLGSFQAGVSYVAASAIKSGGNTGNPTFGTITPGANAVAGVYLLRMTSATAYTLTNPNSVALQTGVLGTAYPNATGELGFTLTAGGTPAVSGDGFDITLTASGLLAPSNWFFMGPADAQGFGEVAINI